MNCRKTSDEPWSIADLGTGGLPPQWERERKPILELCAAGCRADGQQACRPNCCLLFGWTIFASSCWLFAVGAVDCDRLGCPANRRLQCSQTPPCLVRLGRWTAHRRRPGSRLSSRQRHRSLRLASCDRLEAGGCGSRTQISVRLTRSALPCLRDWDDTCAPAPVAASYPDHLRRPFTSTGWQVRLADALASGLVDQAAVLKVLLPDRRACCWTRAITFPQAFTAGFTCCCCGDGAAQPASRCFRADSQIHRSMRFRHTFLCVLWLYWRLPAG